MKDSYWQDCDYHTDVECYRLVLADGTQDYDCSPESRGEK